MVRPHWVGNRCPPRRQPFHLRRPHRRAFIFFTQLNAFGASAAVQIRAKLVAIRDAAHGGDHFRADNKRTNIAPSRFFDKRLQKHILTRHQKRLDDGLRRLLRFGENDADALRSLEQFYDDGGGSQ